MDLEHHIVQGGIDHKGRATTLNFTAIPMHVSAQIITRLELIQEWAQSWHTAVIPLTCFIQKTPWWSMGNQQVNRVGRLFKKGQQFL